MPKPKPDEDTPVKPSDAATKTDDVAINTEITREKKWVVISPALDNKQDSNIQAPILQENLQFEDQILVMKKRRRWRNETKNLPQQWICYLWNQEETFDIKDPRASLTSWLQGK